MRYTEPKIIRTDDAVSAIQSQTSTNPNKPSSSFVDSVKACTHNAYEADE